MRRVRALLDTSVRLSTTTHELICAWNAQRTKSAFTQWLSEAPTLRVFRNKTYGQSVAIYSSIRKLAELAKNGTVILYESDETLAEFLNFRPPTGFGVVEYDLLRDVKIQHVRAPIARGFVIDANYSPTQARQAFRDFLGQVTHPRFQQLLKFTAGSHAADIYHLWTAEHSGIEAFITIDIKFVNAVTKPKPIDSPVKVCTPAEFVQWRLSRDA
jgi:predicted nucleic acid-binding protein